MNVMSGKSTRNTQEVAAGALVGGSLAPELQQVLQGAKERLQEIYGDRLRRVILCGSQVRGDAREDSDVDVLVALEGALDGYEEYGRLAAVKMDLVKCYGLSFPSSPSPKRLIRTRGVPSCKTSAGKASRCDGCCCCSSRQSA